MIVEEPKIRLDQRERGCKGKWNFKNQGCLEILMYRIRILLRKYMYI